MKALTLDTSKLVEICRANDVEMVAVFGSTARGDTSPDSDIDVLIRFTRRRSLLALVRLERELSVALGRKVDLLTEASISPYIRKPIARDLRVLYETR